MKNRSSARGAPAGERRVSEYLVVIREHWKTATLVALLVLGLFVVWTLYATPVYQTAATIQLSEKGAEQQVLADLSSVETASSVETEMQVMRSFKVAEGATERFSLESLRRRRNDPPLRPEQFMPFVDDDAAERGHLFTGVLVGEKERERLRGRDEGGGKALAYLCPK